MYVCVCAALTERELRRQVESGVHTLEQLSSVTGCGTGCGCCRQFASEQLEVLCSDVPASRELACAA
jgi:bacterioferritin-associated ferredoxin